jgi:hypothetical protein
LANECDFREKDKAPDLKKMEPAKDADEESSDSENESA